MRGLLAGQEAVISSGNVLARLLVRSMQVEYQTRARSWDAGFHDDVYRQDGFWRSDTGWPHEAVIKLEGFVMGSMSTQDAGGKALVRKQKLAMLVLQGNDKAAYDLMLELIAEGSIGIVEGSAR